MVPGRPRGRARVAQSATGSSSATAAGPPATSRRTTGCRRSAAPHGPGSRTTAPRPVVPAPLRLRAARLQLAQPRRRRPVRERAALLVRPRRRRVPDRRRARPPQGPPGCPTGTRSASATTRRCGTSRTCTRSIGAGGRSPTPTWGATSPSSARSGSLRSSDFALYLRDDELQQGFYFDLLTQPWKAPDIRGAIERGIKHIAGAGATVTWTLSNHDVHRTVTRYGQDQDHVVADNDDPAAATRFRGPVDLEQGSRFARAAILMLLALPGSVYLYQGEELGLPEVMDLPLEVRQDPLVVAATARSSGATAAAYRCRGSPTSPRSASRSSTTRPSRGCRSRTGSPTTPPTSRSTTPRASSASTAERSSCGGEPSPGRPLRWSGWWSTVATTPSRSAGATRSAPSCSGPNPWPRRPHGDRSCSRARRSRAGCWPAGRPPGCSHDTSGDDDARRSTHG